MRKNFQDSKLLLGSFYLEATPILRKVKATLWKLWNAMDKTVNTVAIKSLQTSKFNDVVFLNFQTGSSGR